ncbi:4,5-DOPA dioxygenase extradiol [Ramlibacter henchirensis]|uniref:4,5-DOPA dioxygenase extradiol n=1 Tax=Ramlibacter henchirensis TaxID=204072 RepID=A0A4Z0BPA1_9BURK|nr:4,5-DOPA dioxygenase extradiol [Ramlibacter henchirensis]TFZ00651.1 4,5-DOPA dioxygenase extradiol [Ramlibacter henchirensis]
MTTDASDLSLSLQSLRPSARLPALFIGHGSPMNVIQDNEWRRGWQAFGREFVARWPAPRLILCVSAHWLTHGWWITGMERPKTIHDFGNFPPELFAQQYPAPGAPEAAREIAKLLGAGVDEGEWGLDHGSWSVLKPMFPEAGIPVVQLSLDWDRPPAEHLAMGRRLRALRDRGVLVVGTGNTVHNLRVMRRELPSNQAYDWTVAFDSKVADCVRAGDIEGLARFESWGEMARLAHPSYEHFLPLLYAAGAAEPGEPVRFFNEGYQGASIAMRSIVWG